MIFYLFYRRKRLAAVTALLFVRKDYTGRLLADGLDVPGDEAPVHTAADKLLALVVPADAGQPLGTVISLLLFL